MLIAWGIAAAWYLADVLYIWFHGNNVMNSDLAAELILAKELNREGTLLSTNWYYSSELRVLNTSWDLPCFLIVGMQQGLWRLLCFCLR